MDSASLVGTWTLESWEAVDSDGAKVQTSHPVWKRPRRT
jgi:hypothetical protein